MLSLMNSSMSEYTTTGPEPLTSTPGAITASAGPLELDAIVVADPRVVIAPGKFWKTWVTVPKGALVKGLAAGFGTFTVTAELIVWEAANPNGLKRLAVAVWPAAPAKLSLSGRRRSAP